MKPKVNIMVLKTENVELGILFYRTLVTIIGISTRTKSRKAFAIQVASTFSCSVFEKES